jgi:predicted nucleic acid-binding protein
VIFVDTSAFYAIFDLDDANHSRAQKIWTGLIKGQETLVCNNYVLVETCALLQHRFGVRAVVDLQKILPLIQIDWITAELHRVATTALLTANVRALSLVDCSGFATMRHLGIEKAFAFDTHFRQQGFNLVV